MAELSRLFVIDWATGTDVTMKEAVVRLALAVALGAVVGIDRELRNKPLGLRTNMLVALGAASFSLMALQLVDLLRDSPTIVQIDPVRVMEAIVGAIGFSARQPSSRAGSRSSAPPPVPASGSWAPSAWPAVSASTPSLSRSVSSACSC